MELSQPFEPCLPACHCTTVFAHCGMQSWRHSWISFYFCQKCRNRLPFFQSYTFWSQLCWWCLKCRLETSSWLYCNRNWETALCNDYANFVFTFPSFRFFHSTKHLADINIVVVSPYRMLKSLFCVCFMNSVNVLIFFNYFDFYKIIIDFSFLR